MEHCFLSDSGRKFQTMGPETEKHLFSKGLMVETMDFQQERCQESATSQADGMSGEGQKDLVAYCSDRYTGNREKQFCIAL